MTFGAMYDNGDSVEDRVSDAVGIPCPECGFDGPSPRWANGTIECGSCYIEYNEEWVEDG